MRKQGLVLALTAAIAAVPATRVAADGGDFIAGALLGGVAGAVINENRHRHAYTTRSVNRYYGPSRVSTANYSGSPAVRRVQSALNYFGYDAGRADGVSGSRTSDAMSSYQDSMGYPVTGRLAPYEEQFLLTSYDRAEAGGRSTQEMMATTPGGGPGLLRKWRDEMAQNDPAPSDMPNVPEGSVSN